MSNFNYTEYLKNNPLLKPEVKDSLITESKEVTEEVQETSSKMKVSELKAKIKEDIMSLLQEEKEEDYINPGNTEEEARDREEYLEKFGMPPHMREEEDNSSELENELMADLDEEITEAEEDEEDVDVEDIEAEIEADEEEVGGGDIDAIDPEAGLTQDEQDIQNALKVAFDNATQIGDDKLADQIGNTITMFTRTHVVNR
jgi:hypothetical protein